MIKRNTVIMVVVLALLAVLTYYLQQPNNLIQKAFATTGTPTSVPLGGLLPLNAGPLSKLSIQSADGQSVTIALQNAGWILTIGTGAPVVADQTLASTAASQAISISLVGRITNVGTDLSVYGLSKPAYTLTCKISDGTTFSAKIGNATVTGSGYYILKPDGSVVIAEKSGIDSLINLISQPPLVATSTPSPLPATDTPGAAATATQTPLSDLTPTKQP